MIIRIIKSLSDHMIIKIIKSLSDHMIIRIIKSLSDHMIIRMIKSLSSVGNHFFQTLAKMASGLKQLLAKFILASKYQKNNVQQFILQILTSH
jgi:hypothetical protein